MLFNRCIAVGVTILFLSIAIVSVAGTPNVKKSLNKGEPPIPQLEGNKGQNDWYISNVLLTFSYSPENVQEINYYLDGQWHEYIDEPVIIEDEGIYSINWYWIDEIGEQHAGWPIAFEIDKSSPNIKLTKKIEAKQIVFNAACNDGMIGIEKVEFYLDDELVETDDDGPYSYTWIGAGRHEVYAIGYNNAGLTEQSEILDTTPKSKTVNYQLLGIILQRIYNIFLLYQQITLF